MIDTLQNYLKQKKEGRWLRRVRSIEKLHRGIFTASRNDTNNRLNNNFTTLLKSTLQIIMDDNCLVEIDMSNCHSAILAYRMENAKGFVSTPDFRLFKKHAGEGTLYRCLADYFEITQGEAKLMMMLLGYSSNRKTKGKKELIEKLNTLFPTVVKFIRDKKAEYRLDKKLNPIINGKENKGEKRFAIDNQWDESYFFIDVFYPIIKGYGFFAIPKHDSFIVRAQDVLPIFDTLQEFVDVIKFSCKFRCEHADNVREIESFEEELKHLSPEFLSEIEPSEHVVIDENLLSKWYI